MSKSNRRKKPSGGRRGENRGSSDQGRQTAKQKTANDSQLENTKSSEPRGKIKPGEKAQNATKPTQRSRFWFAHEDPIVSLTWWIACFTFFLLVTAGFQAWAFRISERAIVTTDGLKVNEGSFVGDIPLKLVLTFHNFGRSTAFPIRFVAAVAAETPPDIPSYQNSVIEALTPIAPDSISRNVLWPLIDNKEIELTSDQANGIESGTIKYFVYGIVEYVDPYTFWGNYSTGFCYQYFPKETSNGKFLTCDNPKYTYAN
jgi:hypothetical protein